MCSDERTKQNLEKERSADLITSEITSHPDSQALELCAALQVLLITEGMHLLKFDEILTHVIVHDFCYLPVGVFL